MKVEITLRVKLEHFFVASDFRCVEIEVEVAHVGGEELIVGFILDRESILNFLDLFEIRC